VFDERLESGAGMDASAALAELLELSTQIVEAVVVSADGEVAASRAASDERARELVSAGADLLSSAAAIRSPDPGVERVHVDVERGSLVVVRDGERSIVATTIAEPTVGLVAFDLRATLRRLREATA
jgi:predicted regulator of Ras-like GTPase activity (Roadblock/LC7/MglB family)